MDAPLSVDAVRSLLGDAGAVFDVELRDSCASTNSQLLSEIPPEAGLGRVLVCENQTAGRGRRDRTWYSVPGGSLTFSVAWSFPPGSTVLAGLSLAVGVAIAQALEGLGVPDVRLKWPNDILAGGGKLGGILIEASSRPGQATTAVVGIGINHALPVGLSLDADLPPIDLRRVHERPPTRNAVLAGTLSELARELPVFAERGFAPFRDRFLARAAFLGEEVVVRNDGAASEAGRYAGVDDMGALLLSTPRGMSRVLVGDVSLRPVS